MGEPAYQVFRRRPNPSYGTRPGSFATDFFLLIFQLLKIFGQSAGGASIATLLTSPLSLKKPLFRAAIAQSDPMALMFRSPEDQQQRAELFSALLGCPISSLECLKTKSASEIVSKTLLDLKLPIDKFDWRTVVSQMPWVPTLDGVVVSSNPIDAFSSSFMPSACLCPIQISRLCSLNLPRAGGKVVDVPILIGAVSNETLGSSILLLCHETLTDSYLKVGRMFCFNTYTRQTPRRRSWSIRLSRSPFLARLLPQRSVI